MKKLSLKYLYPFYMKYGKSVLFNSIVPLSALISTSFYNLLGMNFLCIGLLITFILTVFVVAVSISSTLKYNWEDLTEDQKISVGETDNTLTFTQQCEWTKLYGAKISRKNDVKS